ncbi:hypothetical protein HYS82_02285 [Candidatus Amesbacteria bacterium]|nr:hypothetical protein [Candidatus Amesbacteria bacterium]
MNILVVLALALFLAGGIFRQTKAVSSFPIPTVPVTVTLIPSPTKIPVTVTVTLTPSRFPVTDWQYPGSARVSSNTYESSDSPDKITDWYQDKIKQLGLNTKTFVRTKTNDRVLNKLVAAGKSLEIRVEITKNPSDSVTQITVNY